MDVDAAAGQQPNTYELACLEEMAKLQVSLNSMSARPWFWFSGTLVLDMWEYVEAKWSEEEQLGIVPGFWPLQPAFGLLIKRCVSVSFLQCIQSQGFRFWGSELEVSWCWSPQRGGRGGHIKGAGSSGAALSQSCGCCCTPPPAYPKPFINPPPPKKKTAQNDPSPPPTPP